MLAPVLAFAAGCSHYGLGTEGRLDFTTIYVKPVVNRTLLPQAQAMITSQLRDAFEKDGRVTLVNSPQAAEASLEVVLLTYRREVAAVREQGTGLASKLAITLTLSCTLRDNRTGRPYFENRLLKVNRAAFTDSGNPNSSLVGDQLQSEYNTVPLLAQEAARVVSHSVLDVW